MVWKYMVYTYPLLVDSAVPPFFALSFFSFVVTIAARSPLPSVAAAVSALLSVAVITVLYPLQTSPCRLHFLTLSLAHATHEWLPDQESTDTHICTTKTITSTVSYILLLPPWIKSFLTMSYKTCIILYTTLFMRWPFIQIQYNKNIYFTLSAIQKFH